MKAFIVPFMPRPTVIIADSLTDARRALVTKIGKSMAEWRGHLLRRADLIVKIPRRFRK